VDSVESRGLAGGPQALVGYVNARALPAALTAPTDRRCCGGLDLGKEHALERVGADHRRLLEPRGHGLRAILAEELPGTLRNGQKAHDAFLRLDHAAFPLGQLDAERLRETAHDVEDQREALGRAAGRALLVLLVVVLLFVLVLVACALRRLPVGALERPEEKRREPRVLLNGAGGAVAGTSLGSAEHLRERAPAHDLPDFLQVLGERDFAALGGLHLRVAAENLERGSDAGKDEVGAPDAFAL
jgi:hypothetical protein